MQPEPCAFELLQQGENLDDLHQACIVYTNETGLTDYTLVKLELRSKQLATATIFTNHHFNVSAIFTTHSYDIYKPALERCQQQITPFVEIINKYRNSTFLQPIEYHDYCLSGSRTPVMGINLYFPFHVRFQYTGFFKLSGNSQHHEDTQKNILHGKLFADYLADKISQLQNKTQQPVNLTDKESQCLYILADGGSYEDIGNAIGVSTETVTYHIKKLLTKLGAKNRFQAIALAISDNKIPARI